MMKKLLQMLWMTALLLGGSQVQALTLSGTVLDASGTAQVGYPVYYEIISGNTFIQDTAFVAINGWYSATETVPAVPGFGDVLLWVYDCNGSMIMDTVSFISPYDSVFSTFTVCTGNPGCNASYNFANIGGSTFQFTNYSTGGSPASPLFYSWDFNDGTTSSAQNPTHTFPGPGTYTVCLTVTDTVANCSDVICYNLTVGSGNTNSCSALFSVNPIGPNLMEFTADSLFNSLGAWVTWDFGDGVVVTFTNSSISVDTIHWYSTPGTYTACLYVYDFAGTCADSTCQTFTVLGPQPCQASFSAWTTQGMALGYADTTGATGSTTYFWDYGDGNTGTGSNLNHQYSAPGVYNVCLVVADTSVGCIDSVCQTIQVAPWQNTCNAAFSTDTVAVNTVQFYDQSTSGSTINSWYWAFGDGTTSTLQNPLHVYPAAGTYFVTLVISDISGCGDTTVQPVIVVTDECDATFSTYQISYNHFYFSGNSNTGLSPDDEFTWDFGDGNTVSGASNFANINHIYTAVGTYLVCLTVEDTLAGCIDTYCDSVVVTTIPVCAPDFSYTLTGAGTVQFTNLSNPLSPATTLVYWNFGDGNSSNAFDPTHTYATSGTYAVCMTIIDSMSNCFASHCDTIVISLPTTYSISGYVEADSMPVDSGVAYLIWHDTVTQSLNLVDSTFIWAGNYQFSNVSSGSYLVKAALLPGTFNYANYLPTYLGDVALWNLATTTVVNSASVVNPTISLIAGTNPGGPGFIGGLISAGANKQSATPMMGIQVILYDAQDVPVAQAISGSDGTYAFNDLPLGAYKVHVDIAGYHGTPWEVTLDAANPSADLSDFIVDEVEQTVTPAKTTSLSGVLATEKFEVYPVPAQSVLKVELTLTQAQDISWELTNVMGARVQSGTLSGQRADHQMELNVSNLANGFYLIRFQSAQGQLIQKVQVLR
ncbi:PKD domain-containing protein [Pontibacter sp. G13]|uniref:PKD domain-containing protein n=1 Tax=Pontibacter sp. G13 TaxID=3074898 RepID=UPI002889E80E|nr:PKD domain-containing protein [Pontibacter sp. G13]WNJ19978.1 PKD domain-containing protein [Pontibacter sp. G13]